MIPLTRLSDPFFQEKVLEFLAIMGRDRINDYFYFLAGDPCPNLSADIPWLEQHYAEFSTFLRADSLFEFQKDGLCFLEGLNGRALLADEMGLGKTCQALAWVRLHPEAWPVLIVCPACVKLNWEREVKKWVWVDPEVVYGEKNFNIPGDIIIINYDILLANLDQLLERKPRTLILDECHYIKSGKNQRTKATRILAKYAKHLIGISGTPILNRPSEFYSILSLLKPTMFRSHFEYVWKFCKPYKGTRGWNYSGADNLDELHRLTQSVMIRRLKKDVLKDLPEKQRAVVPLELNEDFKREYYEAEGLFISWIRENRGEIQAAKAKRAEALVKMSVLRQLAVQAKLEHGINWIWDYLDSGNKLVVGVHHREVFDYLMIQFADYCVGVNGSIPVTDRTRIAKRFQTSSEVRLFIANIKACGVGINELSVAPALAFFELASNPGEALQFEDRIHRIGQQAKDKVMIYYLIAADTIEEDLAAAQDRKARILEKVLDGKVHTADDQFLLPMLDSFLAKHQSQV